MVPARQHRFSVTASSVGPGNVKVQVLDPAGAVVATANTCSNAITLDVEVAALAAE
jgi:hypothetical protein